MEHNKIAYHPIRVSPHASLFLPYSQQELQVYRFESLNTLRRSPYQPTTTKSTNNNNPTEEHGLGNSPTHYTTPSPFSIPLESSSSRTYPSNDPYPFHPTSSSSSKNQNQLDSNTAIVPHLALSHPLPPDLADRSNKRTRYNPPSGDPDPQISIAETVAQHYNSRPNLTKGARTESPIFGLRKLNNWIKSVIIGKFGSVESQTLAPIFRPYQNQHHHHHHNHHQQQQQYKVGTKVLELGCGKGGDLAKWQSAGVRQLYGFDIARVSVEQAQSRYMQGCQKKFYAKFVTLDCFALPITSVLGPEELREPFHAVSLQFCMHYAFESEAKVRTMMENVTKFLIPGGVMIGTIPDPDLLLENWQRSSMDGSNEPCFGNNIYQITFPYPLTQNHKLEQVYGNRYKFYLQDAVDNVPEYLVLWEPFVQIAREYGLRLIYKQGFHDIVEKEKDSPQFHHLLSKMNLVDSTGNLLISNDHWEASGIYLAFAFVKD